MTAPVILPGSLVNGQPATLGVMGGGQLGRMFVHAAQRMGYFTAVLDPDTLSPAGLVSHHHIQTAYLDAVGLTQLAHCSAAITTEFENVPAPALQQLAATRPVSPAAASVAIAQDRAQEKADISQRREVALVDENQRLREENARLRGEFQIVSDTALRASVGAQINRKQRDNHPAFSDEPWPSNAAPEPLGKPYLSVSKDVQESARILERMEAEMPDVVVTPEARLLAGGL